MSSTEMARVLGRKREKKRRRLILSGSDEDDDNIVSTTTNKGLDESGDEIKVETKSDLGLKVVKQAKAVEVHQNGVEDSKKIASPIEEKSTIDGSTHIEEVKVESNMGLSSEAVNRMKVYDGKKIENATPKKEINAKYELVFRSKDVMKHKDTDASVDSRNGSGSTIKVKNSLDCSPSKDAMKIDAKKVLKSKVGNKREGVDSKKFCRSDHDGSRSTAKIKNCVYQQSGKEAMKVGMKKVLKSKVIKGREEADGNKKSPAFSVSSRKTKNNVLLEEKKVEYKKVLRSAAVVKEREEAEFEKKKAMELGSERKRSRETFDHEFYSKKFRSDHVKQGQELSSEPGEKNMKRKYLKSGDEGSDNRQRDESDEKTMQEGLKKKNEPESENGIWMERSTARMLRKLKNNSTPSGGVRSNDADISQQNGISVQGKRGVLRVSNKKASEIEGVRIQKEEKESKKFTGNHPSLSMERKIEKPISTVKKPCKVSVPEAKTAREASSPKVSLKKVTSSNITTDPIAKGETQSKSKASVLTKLNTEDEGHKGGKGGSKQRSTAKQKVRDEIKGILLDAGWKIDLRPRRGRSYEDAVYIPPTGGGGFWSITKAYAKYMEYCKKSNASSEKQSKKTTGGDHDHEGTTPTFATVPANLLNMLTRNVVNKRRSREEIERDEMLGVRKERIARRDVSEVGKVRNKRRGCALLVRGANPDANTDDNDDYVPYIWKRTIMSWMIDLGVVQLDGKVKYMNKKQTRALLEGSITRDGICCGCCSKILSISKFEIHAGSKLHQPYQNIIVEETGDSLLQCQVNAWGKQQESEWQGFYRVDIEGDDPNDDTCGICGDGGDLICCDGCPSTFHLNCLDILMLPPGEWHCTNCSCRYCGLVSDAVCNENYSDISTLLTCLQCEEKYHLDCIPEADVISVSSNDSDASFCGESCKKVFKKLQKLIGTKNDLEAGLSWRLIRRYVMDECFCPIIDYRSGINLIHNVVYNCGSNINRLSYTGFYTFVLERGDEIIAVASVRNHGTRLAEMPFIGTRNMYRRQGMCRQLLNGIESALYYLNVEKLIIPAISELTETWTNIFGFKHLDLSQRQEVRTTNMLVFPGTGLLQKPILSKGSTEEHTTFDGGELGESVSEEKRTTSSERAVYQNQEADNAASKVALGSNATGDNSVGCASVIENQHLLGAANESSESSFKPKLYGADEGITNNKFEPAVVFPNEPMVEDTFRIRSSSEPKIEAPCGVMMLNHETKDRGVTGLFVVNGSSERHATEDGYAPLEATGENITHNVHSNGDTLLPQNCVVCCNSAGINSSIMQDCDGCSVHVPCFPRDCSSDATHLHSFESTVKSSSSSVEDQGSLVANEHFVDGNHVRGTYSTIFQAELKPFGNYLSHSDSGINAKLVDSMEGKDPSSFMEPNLYAVGECSGNGVYDVKAELGPVKLEANAVDQDTEPCTDSVNDRPFGITQAKSEANGSSVNNNSCNITEPDNGMSCDGCSHRQHMVARDSAPVVLSNSASCAFTDGTLLDPHVHGSVAKSPKCHSAEDFSCGVGPSICMRGTSSGGSLNKEVVQEVGKIPADESANPDHCCAEGV